MPPRKRTYLGRKDFAAAFCLVVPTACCTVMTFVGKMSAETYVGYLQLYMPAIVGLYFGGNVAQKAFEKRRPDPEPCEGQDA